MKEQKCANCGAPLTRTKFGTYKCEYCGTEYKTSEYQGQTCYIQVVNAACHTLTSKVHVDEELVRRNPEMASEMVVESLSRSLADTLKEYMTIQSSYDPMDMSYIYRGTIRVVPEAYRY